jgi:NAD(P)H dehydrogenase (quinone)
MKIAVTGATGQLGQLVVEQLKKRIANEEIVALARKLEKASGLGVEVREFDYTKPEIMEASLKGIDYLLLISGSEFGQRAAQHTNVINAAKKAGVKWIVYTSLLRADTTGINIAGEHLASEKALKESGITYTILRNGWYSGNYTMSIPGALKGGAFLGSAKDGKISSAPRADYAEAAAIVLTDESYKGKTFELAGDSSYTLSDLAAEVSKQSGESIPYKDIPEQEYANILKNIGLPEGMANAFASWDVNASKGDLFDDSKTLSKILGRPTTPISESIKAALN